MKQTARQLIELKSPFLEFVRGNELTPLEKPAPNTSLQKGATVFVSTSADLVAALAFPAGVVVAKDSLNLQDLELLPNQALFRTKDIKAAMAMALPLFDIKRSKGLASTHPSAVIANSAKLGKNLQIGPFVVIEEGAVIGDNAVLGPHVVVESEASIGKDCVLHAQVVLGHGCLLGDRVIVHAGTVIGSDGFGYIPGSASSQKVAQVGTVRIGNDVEIGANCAIDRATIGETVIGNGCKFDNLCHIAHNVRIGSNSLFAAGFCISGSSEVGDNCIVAGAVVVADHVKIGNNILIGGRSAVTSDTLEAGAYTGYPLEKFSDAKRTIASLPHLKVMRKQLSRIIKQLGLGEEL